MVDVVVAPDKFKGSLTAPEVGSEVAVALRDVRPGLRVAVIPVADGGDGFLVAALAAGYRSVPVPASGPTGEPLTSAYARRGDTAVIELADTAGLWRLPGGRLAPLTASSTGTGEVMRAALDAGCRTLMLGVGGSACTDGGAGMLTALGARIRGAPGPGGGGLAGVTGLDLSGLHPALPRSTVLMAADVDNPLLGASGAARFYGPQKGATPADVLQLEAGMRRWAELMRSATGRDVATVPGAGAAGGVGFAALAALGAIRRSGIEVVMELTGLADQLTGARLVITGEGSLDEQTLRGKAPTGVAALAGTRGIPVVAVAGRCTLGPERLRAAGFAAAYALSDLEPEPRRCMADAGPLLRRLTAKLADDWLPD
jgi:glycerate kinase